MKTTEAGLRFIAGHEGIVLSAYRDIAGVWTIGIGHTSRAGPPQVRPGMRISREEAFEILARDVATFEAAVSWPSATPQRCAESSPSTIEEMTSGG